MNPLALLAVLKMLHCNRSASCGVWRIVEVRVRGLWRIRTRLAFVRSGDNSEGGEVRNLGFEVG